MSRKDCAFSSNTVEYIPSINLQTRFLGCGSGLNSKNNYNLRPVHHSSRIHSRYGKYYVKIKKIRNEHTSYCKYTVHISILKTYLVVIKRN